MFYYLTSVYIVFSITLCCLFNLLTIMIAWFSLWHKMYIHIHRNPYLCIISLWYNRNEEINNCVQKCAMFLNTKLLQKKKRKNNYDFSKKVKLQVNNF